MGILYRMGHTKLMFLTGIPTSKWWLEVFLLVPLPGEMIQLY